MGLPGISAGTAGAATVDEAQIQFGHYEEGGRQFWAGPNANLKSPQPLRVDTMRARTGLRLTDRLRFGLEFLQDTWSGATPYISAPIGFIALTGASLYVAADKACAAARVDRTTLTPFNLTGTPLVPQARVVNLMTGASPETRNQLRLTLDHEWNDFALGFSARASDESDYKSVSLGVSGRWDFNQKRTSLSAGFTRTASRIDAHLGPPSPFIDYDLYTNPASGPRIEPEGGPGLSGGVLSAQAPVMRFRGTRDDTAINFGLTQVLNRNATLSLGLNYARGTGFLENPHKLVLMGFANPATPPVFNYLFTTLFAMPEKRPDTHNQLTWTTQLAQYVPALDAALHLGYNHARDSWGIKSHTVEAKWVQPLGDDWSITPKLRYYTQSAARFYQPYFLFRQAYPRDVTKPGLLDFTRMPIEHWSSDERLSAFGARSIGLVVTKRLARDIRLEIGIEEYLRAGRLKYGGGGSEGLADIRAKMINVGLSLDLGARAAGEQGSDRHGGGHDAHGHEHHAVHPGADAPAGVMHAHMLDQPGTFMVAYGYHYARQHGSMLQGTRTASDGEVVRGCGAAGCPTAPKEMTMHMHMLHFMYAATDNVNLMVMPQLVSMKMSNRLLEGGFYTPVGHVHTEMDMSGHASGGIGDTTIGALIRLARGATGGVHLGLNVSAPTGSIKRRMPSHGNELQDYGMQLGSGTWDILPSLTYTGAHARWSWGAQASRVVRLQGPNDDGYTLGDVTQATAWLGYRVTQALSVSLRAAHTIQGGVRGALRGENLVIDGSGNVTYPRPQHSSTDVASNYGGRYTDIAIGMSIAVPGRPGDRIGLEWIAPVRQDVNGYQLERSGSLALNWNMMF